MTHNVEQRLITVEEYHKMGQTGILRREDRVELLNGQIIKMSPIGSKHAALVEKIGSLLSVLLADQAMVRTQNPIVLNDLTEPEPDLAIVTYKANYYADQHPSASDVLLVIEIADSSIEKDRQIKMPIYAAAGIPEYWIVNAEAGEIEVYQLPLEQRYRSRRIFLPADEIPIGSFELSCRVGDLLV